MAFVYPAHMRQVEYAEPNCSACMLNRASRIPTFGKGGKKILVIFENQESIQQTQKTYAIGDKYMHIKDILMDHNVYIDEDCWVTSALACYAQEPGVRNADACKPLLTNLIKQLKPRMVIAMGDLTARMLMQDQITDDKGVSVDRLHGLIHNSRRFECEMMFTYQPHVRNPSKKSVQDILIERDIRIAMQAMKRERVVWKKETDCVRVLSTKEAIAELTKSIEDTTPRIAAVDYETNTLRPYNDAAKIYSFAISESDDDSFSFRMDDEVVPYVRAYWETQHILKVAQNTAFERMWTMVKLGVTPNKLSIDTMLLIRSMDNRAIPSTSIKFTAPMLLGTPEWNHVAHQYIIPSKEDKAKYGSYAYNKIFEAPQRPILLYGGVDSLVERRAFKVMWQMMRDYNETFGGYND